MLIAAQDHNAIVVMNPGSKYIVAETSVFFCIADDEDSLDQSGIRRDEGRVWLKAYEENRKVVAARKKIERMRQASEMARPALLALLEMKGVGGADDSNDLDADTSKKAKRANTTAAGKSGTGVGKGGMPAIGPGVIGRLAGIRGVRAQPDDKKKKTAEKKPLHQEQPEDLFEQEETTTPSEEDLAEIVEQGGHIVVVGMGQKDMIGLEDGALLPQLTTIIRQLRTPFLPEALLSVPIVILYDYEIKEKVQAFVKGYKKLVYVQGSPLKLRSLLKVGADRCTKMLIVSGGNGSHPEPIMTDQDAILVLSMLESQEQLWGKLPTVICQLHVPSNIKQLSESLASEERAASQQAATQRSTKSPRKLSHATSFGSFAGASDEGKERGKETGRQGEVTERAAKAQTQSSQGIRTHLRYASGCIIHRAEFSSLFAAAYYTPGVLDLLKSMCQPPQSAHSSIVW